MYLLNKYFILLTTVSYLLISLYGHVYIKKVGIIGAGVGGLGLASTIKELNSKVYEVDIYDTRDNILESSLGGGLQLTSGSVIIEKLGYLNQLRQASARLSSVVSRNMYGDEVLRLDLDNIVKNIASKQLCSNDNNNEPMLFSIMRDSLIQLLYNITQSTSKTIKDNNRIETEVRIKSNKKLKHLIEHRETNKISLYFDDNSSEHDYDMVIGADGINSIVKSYVTCDNNHINNKQNKITYSGLRITYCITPKLDDLNNIDSLNELTRENKESIHKLITSLRINNRNSFHQWFGDGVYVLLASYGNSINTIQHMLIVVYSNDNDAIYGENSDWKLTTNIQNNIKDNIYKLLNKSGLSENKDILEILNAVSIKGFEGKCFDLGVRDSIIPLKKWSSLSGRVVLLGDSAHAMSPFLGQGANQALQDSYCLGSMIRNYNNKYYAIQILNNATTTRSPLVSVNSVVNNNDIDVIQSNKDIINFVNNYESKRKLPTALLSIESSILGKLETLGTPLGCFIKETFFKFMNKTGIAGFIYILGAIPKL